jgi:DNA-binding protein H-NS
MKAIKMAKTYTQALQDVKTAETVAAKIREKEIVAVIAKIKVAIDFYKLTPESLGFNLSAAEAPAAPGVKTRKARTPKLVSTVAVKTQRTKKTASNGVRTAKKAALPMLYGDASGNRWSGRGPRPAWMKAALAAGADLPSLLLTAPAEVKDAAANE